MTKFTGVNGKRFAIMERFDIVRNDEPDDIYLTRWRIIQTPWASLYLHHIRRPDADPFLHDHPWSFISIILNGSYREDRKVGTGDGVRTTTKLWKRFSIHRLRATDAHRIINVDANTYSLVVTGSRRREWGFLTENGWTPWRKYLSNKDVYDGGN